MAHTVDPCRFQLNICSNPQFPVPTNHPLSDIGLSWMFIISLPTAALYCIDRYPSVLLSQLYL
jgi:hypothetical protein